MYMYVYMYLYQVPGAFKCFFFHFEEGSLMPTLSFFQGLQILSHELNRLSYVFDLMRETLPYRNLKMRITDSGLKARNPR